MGKPKRAHHCLRVGNGNSQAVLSSGAIAATYTKAITLSGGALAGANGAGVPTYASNSTLTRGFVQQD